MTQERLQAASELGGFSYARSNPLRYRDPRGLVEEQLQGALAPKPERTQEQVPSRLFAFW